MALRGLLLDSGDTVIGPRGGRWNPRFDFEAAVLRRWPHLTNDSLAPAIDVGDRFMRDYEGTPPYLDYYRTILDALGVGNDMTSEELMSAFMPPLDAHEVVEVFPDALDALQILHARGVPIVVVSDSWAGLDDAYAALGLRDFFAGFVISEVLGCSKPDARMYAAGSDLLGLPPDQCLFVDDHAGHVAAALDLGYHGRVIARTGPTSGELPSIRSLLEVIDLF